MPLAAAAGFGASRAAAKPSLPSSSLASRFRFDEELIDAGEAGRDNEDAAATPLTWVGGAATAGEAMVGGVYLGAGRWSLVSGWC